MGYRKRDMKTNQDMEGLVPIPVEITVENKEKRGTGYEKKTG